MASRGLGFLFLTNTRSVRNNIQELVLGERARIFSNWAFSILQALFWKGMVGADNWGLGGCSQTPMLRATSQKELIIIEISADSADKAAAKVLESEGVSWRNLGLPLLFGSKRSGLGLELLSANTHVRSNNTTMVRIFFWSLNSTGTGTG